jgi:general secretion pathway protein D
VPVITNSVTPVSTGTPVVTGNVQYLDVGLKLEVEPDIHLDGEVEIKTYLEVSTIANQVTNASSGTVAYQIGTRNVSTVLRLKDGETQVLAGLINDEDRKSAASVPGLGDLPIIGHLFASHGDDKRKTEIILSITPHIIRNNHRPDADLAEFWSGTQDSLSDKPLTLASVGTVSNGVASAPQPYLQSAYPSLPPVTAPLPPVGIAAATQRPIPSEVVPGKLLPGVKTPVAPLLISWQGAGNAKVGDQFKVAVYAQAASRFVSMPLKIDYDSSALEVVAVSKGDLFNGNNAQAVFKSDVNQSDGEVSVDISEPSGQEGIGGRGSLAVITFKVTAANPEVPITVSGSAVNAAGDEVPVKLPAPHNVELTP